MSPELRTNKGLVKAIKLEGDSTPDLVEADILALQIQKLIDNQCYILAKMILGKILPKDRAEEFIAATSEKRKGSIKYKSLDNGEIQITKSSFSEP